MKKFFCKITDHNTRQTNKLRTDTSLQSQLYIYYNKKIMLPFLSRDLEALNFFIPFSFSEILRKFFEEFSREILEFSIVFFWVRSVEGIRCFRRLEIQEFN
ncbi:unnamed protein product [Citrullus colocynthis]|uniref:Uncharacterized protein n=1 Tax=Citrullus colocynthis TaxID=252529 RepID=A0ABP0XPE7_9ROSI